MQINTLWKKDVLGMAELVDAIDDGSIEANNGYPEDYAEKLKEAGVRELIINIPDQAIEKLFKTPIINATVEEES